MIVENEMKRPATTPRRSWMQTKCHTVNVDTEKLQQKKHVSTYNMHRCRWQLFQSVNDYNKVSAVVLMVSNMRNIRCRLHYGTWPIEYLAITRHSSICICTDIATVKRIKPIQQALVWPFEFYNSTFGAAHMSDAVDFFFFNILLNVLSIAKKATRLSRHFCICTNCTWIHVGHPLQYMNVIHAKSQNANTHLWFHFHQRYRWIEWGWIEWLCASIRVENMHCKYTVHFTNCT